MKNLFNIKFICTILSVFILIMPVLALDLDTSVDEEIRRNYNPSKLETDTLPALPKLDESLKPYNTQVSPTIQKTLPKQSTTDLPPKSSPVNSPSKFQFGVKTLPGTSSYNPKRDLSVAIRIKKGTKFRVKSYNQISDSTHEGTKISFVSLKPVYQKYVTIPTGTAFKGVVLDSHSPQLSGNGGLIVMMIDSLVFKGATHSVHAKITKANHKKIFLNNIKGERKYLESIPKTTRLGSNFYRKAMRGTAKLSQSPWTFILTPFTVISGVLAYGVNIVGSPVFAIFSRGGRIIIPAGSEFEIKLLEDVYLD